MEADGDTGGSGCDCGDDAGGMSGFPVKFARAALIHWSVLALDTNDLQDATWGHTKVVLGTKPRRLDWDCDDNAGGRYCDCWPDRRELLLHTGRSSSSIQLIS